MGALRQLALDALARHAASVSSVSRPETPVRHLKQSRQEDKPGVSAKHPLQTFVKHTSEDNLCYDNNNLNSSTGSVFQRFTPIGMKHETRDVPAGAYREALARLAARLPEDVPADRCRRFLADAESFLQNWSDEANQIGWTAEELFGLHPIAPMARCDRMGLLWMLKGERVVEVTATGARLSGGLTFYRKGG
jgi:hypothetical protein